MDDVPEPAAAEPETYNPWTIVNLVFHHLADKGLHPVLGATGDPGPPATALLVALGIEPAAEGNRQVMRDVRDHLATIRSTILAIADPPDKTPDVSHVETAEPIENRCDATRRSAKPREC